MGPESLGAMLCELTAKKKGAELLQPSVCTTIYNVFRFFTYTRGWQNPKVTAIAVGSRPVLLNSHEEFGRQEEHMLCSCKAWSESSRDISVLDLITGELLGLRSWGGVNDLMEMRSLLPDCKKKPEIGNLDKAALGSALPRLQLFPTSYIVRCDLQILYLNITLELHFLEIKICTSLGKHPVNTIQTKSNFTGSGTSFGRWCR